MIFFFTIVAKKKYYGLKRIEKNKIVYIKGKNPNRYVQEFHPITTLENLILMNMNNQKNKKVYIEFPELIGIGINLPKKQIQQINNFDPYPEISEILNLNTDSKKEYFKDKPKPLLNHLREMREKMF